MPRRDPAAGFTLLEVMLALTIFALVAVTLYGTFARTLRTKGIAEERAELTRLGRTALARMSDELTSAFHPEGTGPPLAEGMIFRSLRGGTESAPLDALLFSALSARPAGWSGRDSDLRLLAYFFAEERGRMRGRARSVADDEAVDFFAVFGPRALPAGIEPARLLRREGVLIGTDPLATGTTTVFLDNVHSLTFRFHDGIEWLDGWDSEDRLRYRHLPRAVAIDLALYDAAGNVHHFTTAVDLPLADPRPGSLAAHATGAPTPQPRPTP